MLAVNFTNFRSNLKEYCDTVCDKDDVLIITRKGNRNVVLMSIEHYSEMDKQIDACMKLLKEKMEEKL